jgi:hypothetical protein
MQMIQILTVTSNLEPVPFTSVISYSQLFQNYCILFDITIWCVITFYCEKIIGYFTIQIHTFDGNNCSNLF